MANISVGIIAGNARWDIIPLLPRLSDRGVVSVPRADLKLKI